MDGVTAVAEHSVWSVRCRRLSPAGRETELTYRAPRCRPVFIAIAFVASPFVGLFVSNRAFGKMRAAMEAQVERINASGRFDVEFNIDAEVAQPDGAGAGARRRAARTLRLRIYPRQFVTAGRAPVAADTRGGAQPEIAYAPNHPALRHSTSRVNPVVAHCAVDPYAVTPGGDDATLPSARRDSRAPRRSSFLERLRHSMAPRPSLVQASGADGLELAGDAAAPPSLRQPGELGRAPGNARASAFSLAPRADSRTGPPTPGGGAVAAV